MSRQSTSTASLLVSMAADATVVWERERWTLWADVGLLGYVDITVTDQPWKHGRWRPTEAFGDFAASFDQSRELLHNDDIDTWLQVDASLKQAGVHMRYPGQFGRSRIAAAYRW